MPWAGRSGPSFPGRRRPLARSEHHTVSGLRRTPAVVAAITGLLLAGYLAVVAWAWASPTSDPQAGMAVGFLALVTLFLLGLAGLLWYAIIRGRTGLVWLVFAICALPSLSLVGRGIYLVVRWLGQVR